VYKVLRQQVFFLRFKEAVIIINIIFFVFLGYCLNNCFKSFFGHNSANVWIAPIQYRKTPHEALGHFLIDFLYSDLRLYK